MMMLLAQESGPPPHDGLELALGVAALVLVAGWIATRWHRDRMRFALMRTALERGIARIPGTPPYWLVSLRQGVTLVVVGTGLGVLGAGAWWLVHGVEMPKPPEQTVASQSTQPVVEPMPEVHTPSQIHSQLPQHPPGLRPEDRDFREGPGMPPPRREDLPPPRQEDQRPEDRQMSADHQSQPGEGKRLGQQHHPDPHDPVMEHWHRAEAQQTIGLVTVGIGFILMLLGLVRIGFARVEQRYVSETDEAGIY